MAGATETVTIVEWLSAGAGVATAVAAVAGLVIAILTARNAQQEASAARTALGLVGKPTVHVSLAPVLSGPGTGGLRCAVWVSDQPALDVELVVELRGGQRANARSARVEANTHGEQGAVRGDHLWVLCGPPIPDTVPGEDRITVRYSDQRQMLRWEWTRSTVHTLTTLTDGRVVPVPVQDVREQERVLSR